MLLDIRKPLERRYSRFGSVLLVTMHADPTTTVGAPENGGVTVYVRELARALATHGWSVDIVTRRTSAAQAAREEYLGATLFRIDAGPLQHLKNDEVAQYLPQAYAQVRELARDRDYRFITSHYWLSGVVAQQLADALDIPHVFTPHSHGVERKHRDEVTLRRIDAERELLRKAKIVTLSKAHIDLYRRKYGLQPEVHVVPAGVDTERFKPADRGEALRDLDLAEDVAWVGYVGRLTKEKGMDDLLHAFALLHMRNPKAGLFVVGGARVRSRIPELTQLCERLGIAQAVRFLGPIPNNKVARAFQAADVIAVPSHYEAFGLVALEALACGTPVVASDVGGLRDLVKPEYGGVRVPAQDYVAWAEALEVALRPEVLRERSQLASGIDHDDAHSWEAIAGRFAQIALTGTAMHA